MFLKILSGCGLVAIVLISQNFLNVKSLEEKQEAYHSEIMAATKKQFACDFEVFGRVQGMTAFELILQVLFLMITCFMLFLYIIEGVFFRKYTEKQAKQLGLHGWCMNTREGTVKGQLEGELNAINEMKHWLQTKGSPQSRIDKAVFSDTTEISAPKFTSFGIKR